MGFEAIHKYVFNGIDGIEWFNNEGLMQYYEDDGEEGGRDFRIIIEAKTKTMHDEIFEGYRVRIENSADESILHKDFFFGEYMSRPDIVEGSIRTDIEHPGIKADESVFSMDRMSINDVRSMWTLRNEEFLPSEEDFNNFVAKISRYINLKCRINNLFIRTPAENYQDESRRNDNAGNIASISMPRRIRIKN